MGYKHILLATDLSEAGLQAAQSAQNMAKLCGAKLSVVHVVEYSPITFSGEFAIPVDINLEEIVEAQSRKALEDLAKKFGIAIANVYLRTGSVKHEVQELATEISADLVVVGSHERHGLELLLGSNANAILHVTKCDVLAVRVK